MSVTIAYDEPIEVNQKQYEEVSKRFTGLCAFQEKEGKFYIKLWYLRYATALTELLKQHES